MPSVIVHIAYCNEVMLMDVFTICLCHLLWQTFRVAYVDVCCATGCELTGAAAARSGLPASLQPGQPVWPSLCTGVPVCGGPCTGAGRPGSPGPSSSPSQSASAPPLHSCAAAERRLRAARLLTGMHCPINQRPYIPPMSAAMFAILASVRGRCFSLDEDLLF